MRGVPRARPALLFFGAVAWALFIECMLLLTPYTSFFGLPFDGWFVFLTASAHLVNGAWVDSTDQIEITKTGAQATNSAHKVQFLGDIASPGASYRLPARAVRAAGAPTRHLNR